MPLLATLRNKPSSGETRTLPPFGVERQEISAAFAAAQSLMFWAGTVWRAITRPDYEHELDTERGCASFFFSGVLTTQIARQLALN